MSDKRYRVEILSNAHDRASFSCGEDALDRYIKQSAGQDMRRGLAVVYVLVDSIAPETITGFYALSASSVPLDDFPDEIARRLPKYPNVPISLIGRLATDVRHQGQNCGSRLVVDALVRSCTISKQAMGVHAVVVNAKDEAVAPFYECLGFTRFAETHPPRLFLPIKTAIEVVRKLLPDEPL